MASIATHLKMIFAEDNLLLNGLGLKNIPKPLFKFFGSSKRALRHLNFSDNQLSQIPDWLQEEDISSLNLKTNQFKELPKWIGKFKFLKSLNLSNNKFEFIPSQIRDLTFVEYLDLSHNQLTSVPVWFFEKLERRSAIYLNNNDIKYLPSNFELTSQSSQFSSLKIDLSNNKIERIPYGILYPRFKVIDLSNNNIKTLPSWFFTYVLDQRDIEISFEDVNDLKNKSKYGETRKQGVIYLHGNPLTYPPKEIILQGTEAIVKYFEGKSQSEVYDIEEAKAEAQVFSLGSSQEANKLFRKILEKEPNNIEALLWITQTIKERDRKQYLERILEIDPKNIEAEFGLQILEGKKKSFRSEIPWINKTSEINDDTLSKISALYEKEKRLIDLEEDLEKAKDKLSKKIVNREFFFVYLALTYLYSRFYNTDDIATIVCLFLILVTVFGFFSLFGVSTLTKKLTKQKSERKDLQSDIAYLQFQLNLIMK